jgi:hypothetical protein
MCNSRFSPLWWGTKSSRTSVTPCQLVPYIVTDVFRYEQNKKSLGLPPSFSSQSETCSWANPRICSMGNRGELCPKAEAWNWPDPFLRLEPRIKMNGVIRPLSTCLHVFCKDNLPLSLTLCHSSKSTYQRHRTLKKNFCLWATFSGQSCKTLKRENNGVHFRLFAFI